MTTNAELAARALALADAAMAERKAALCAYAALKDTKTAASARRVLADPELHVAGAVGSAALELITQLEATE